MAESGESQRPGDAHEVLVAGDDDDLRRTIELWFERREEFEVTTVGDGAAALAALDDADAFVCDRRMPTLSGPEVLEEWDGPEDVPVVVVSASEPDDHLDGDDVDAYLGKPLSRGEVAAAVRDALE